jgi:hypothetical protein
MSLNSSLVTILSICLQSKYNLPVLLNTNKVWERTPELKIVERLVCSELIQHFELPSVNESTGMYGVQKPPCIQCA